MVNPMTPAFAGTDSLAAFAFVFIFAFAHMESPLHVYMLFHLLIAFAFVSTCPMPRVGTISFSLLIFTGKLWFVGFYLFTLPD